jgi:hypothetical protein
MTASAAETLRGQLAAQAALYRVAGVNPGAWLAEEFIARVGITCAAQPLPRGYRRAPPKRCFENAATLVRRRPDTLRYCEGYVSRPDVPLLIHHGWAIDAENRVIDPTLPDPADCAYVGLPLRFAEYQAETWQTLRGREISAAVLLDLSGCVRAEFILARCPALVDLMPVDALAALIRREAGRGDAQAAR